MRLVLQYMTADPSHPYGNVDPDQLRAVLGRLGWLPTDDEFAAKKLNEVIHRMPDAIRPQLAGANPILISTRPGLWGVVSMENSCRVFIRLLHDDLATLRAEAEDVVARFPQAFGAEFGHDLGFRPEVVIRRFDNEQRLEAGDILQLHDYRFWHYIREYRRREMWTMLVLITIGSLAIGGSIAAFLQRQTRMLTYLGGYLDRTGSAVLVGCMMLLINLIFEYRVWRNLKVRISWKV